MRTITAHHKFLGLIPYRTTVNKPHIYWSSNGRVPCWVCSNGNGSPGFGQTQKAAWNDLAMSALI